MGKNKATKAKVDEAKVDEAKVDEAKVDEAKVAFKMQGQEVHVKLPSGAEFKGIAMSERQITGQKQIFVKLSGNVSRYFNIEDIQGIEDI